ncbi:MULTISPECIES: 4-hydroxythreonine-4-phosphate dehydrogenase PdxA [Flavobacterium]|jgi:4-phospho-D-threonate 3-dehydrogenase / 4-phospho-D-erythronate 3-dehydrogenase|uniref:4-hydroxythreonine-4-phosphate dehydrogenase PdxA n=1 Tax=Flavobacterium tructae TaxID=1114873 RepID=A0A1S1J834_9FLAO|nr:MULTISPECIES: 4-hydroxythreonine-4-phosphate dehydrogenase PdxA [Flavobacterium]MDL2143840.1 4-hydroxythreonine-4-phosphate dehydrogenase PdxA [Flavobacterium tructae]OHT46822.1 4-hydroxythreonine-4-phosphate dehydrogenase PdxA [Flavobacterium tructae]OXB21130.1 4-hydroxythreonine-4-phosphate dehydrogenase PdxA [Flavobacterium tructae]OXB23542.1 4-hydroxythreonine-4-phosphate dehydrogenase PdxA [Flavobacterium tructae]URC13379.1 4-hydroxythreonine-4-phosphate dehydrogenase PdxA [Flavobacter
MNKKAENIIVGISVGDLNGIGSEVILKTFEDSRMLEMCTPVIFANAKILSFVKKSFTSTVQFHGVDKLEQVLPGKVNVFNLWKEGVDINFGKNDEKIGEYAIKSFVAATKALKEGLVDVLVTAPINKYNIQSEDFKFPGHTDYLDKELEGNALMMMVQDNLRVGLLTDHVPLNEVSSHLTEELIVRKIETIRKSLVQDFSIVKPKIAVLGLNPHSGDGGVIGKEEDLILKPALKKIFEKGTMVFGPFSADGFFGSGQYEKYDAIVATYHDQGLIPFKTLSFGKGVNYTAGLNKVRTSPDHGTAYDIAGKDMADFNSFKEAVYLAIDIFRSRNQYEEITEKPLKIKEKQL